MKNLLVAVSLFLMTLSQTSIAQNINFGMKAGVNISTLTGGEGDRNSLIGFHGGLFSEISISERFYFQPELLYTMQGVEAQNIKFKLDYISVPLMFKYSIVDRVSLDVGPQIAFLVDDRAEFEGNAIPDQESDAETIDYSANIGLGYKFGSNILAQLRYNFGIGTVAENPDLRNSVFQVSVGYIF